MLLLDLIEFVHEHPGEAIFRSLLLILLRNLIHIAKEQELHWIRERVEKLTGEKYPGHTKRLWTQAARNSKILSSYFVEGKRREKLKRRVRWMLKALLSSFSKKLAALTIAAAVTALNKKFGLDLDSEAIYGLYGVTIAYIAGQSHVDAKKLITKAANSIAAAVTESAATTDGSPIQTITAMPMSYNEMLPYLNDISDDLTKVYDALKSGRYNDQTQNALNIAMTVHEYLKHQHKEV